jgi:hypothetical protein
MQLIDSRDEFKKIQQQKQIKKTATSEQWV